MGEVWRGHRHGARPRGRRQAAQGASTPTTRCSAPASTTEARNAAALHHPNVAAVFDFGELPADDGASPRPFLVMELVRGEPLSALLAGGQPMPTRDRAADLLAQAADGLGAAHAPRHRAPRRQAGEPAGHRRTGR